MLLLALVQVSAREERSAFEAKWREIELKEAQAFAEVEDFMLRKRVSLQSCREDCAGHNLMQSSKLQCGAGDAGGRGGGPAGGAGGVAEEADDGHPAGAQLAGGGHGQAGPSRCAPGAAPASMLSQGKSRGAHQKDMIS